MDLFRPTSREFKHFNSIENAVIPHSLPETLPSKEDASHSTIRLFFSIIKGKKTWGMWGESLLLLPKSINNLPFPGESVSG